MTMEIKNLVVQRLVVRSHQSPPRIVRLKSGKQAVIIDDPVMTYDMEIVFDNIENEFAIGHVIETEKGDLFYVVSANDTVTARNPNVSVGYYNNFNWATPKVAVIKFSAFPENPKQ